MNIAIDHRSPDASSYRAERVKSLFNCEDGHIFHADFNLPLESIPDWRIGLVVGPSGSGKTSLGKKLGAFWDPKWPKSKPIVDAIAPKGDFDQVTSALAAVGLGSVPAWLRPFPALSNGEQFRANLARLVADPPSHLAVLDEFTTVGRNLPLPRTIPSPPGNLPSTASRLSTAPISSYCLPPERFTKPLPFQPSSAPDFPKPPLLPISQLIAPDPRP